MRNLPFSIRLALASALACASPAMALTNQFFNPYQTATVLASNITSTTITSRAYLFTYSVDGWWSASPGGPPTGRFQSVLWPAGIDAQAITTGPTLGTSASITIQRLDGQPFDLLSFTGKILGNTAGAGAAFELMPQLNGTDVLPNPLTYDATGYGGQTFGYSPMLSGYDTYVLSLWMDYALTQLTVADSTVITPPQLEISFAPSNYLLLSWSTNASSFTLLQNTNLGSATWSLVTDPVTVVGARKQVAVPTTNGPRFFRLVF